jgi:DNA replication protein DnaC
MDSYERVHEYLDRLGLSVTGQIIDNYLESAKDKPFMEILEHLLEQETKNLRSRKVEMRLNYSGLPFRKTLETFDFSFQPSIDRKTIDDLMTMRFIHNNENVVFLGPPGVGKTHLSVALGMQAAFSEIPIYYVTAVKLVQILRRDFLSSKLSYRLATYSRFPLMIVDEIGYLPLTREESNLFFQFVSSRYEKHSTIYTSNKSFSEWGEVLGDSVMASAVLDRILHHCTVVNIRGDSYRLKERKKLGNTNMGEVK